MIPQEVRDSLGSLADILVMADTPDEQLNGEIERRMSMLRNAVILVHRDRLLSVIRKTFAALDIATLRELAACAQERNWSYAARQIRKVNDGRWPGRFDPVAAVLLIEHTDAVLGTSYRHAGRTA